jgi:hypothetical protein
VSGNDSTYRREPDASAFEFVGSVQPLEDAKQLVHIPHVKSCSVVSNEENGLAVLFTSAADDDFRGAS